MPRRLQPVGLALLMLPTVGLAFASAAAAAETVAPDLRPLMAQPDKVIQADDFSQPKPLAKGVFQPLQWTQWKIADGVLHGAPSTKEFQDSKKDHKGLEPRIAFPASGQEFVVAFSVRFTGGRPTGLIPLVEFGHHFGRVAWPGGGGAKMLADGESVQLAEAADFKIESGKWYHVLAEVKGDELLVQFANGPTLYGRHDSLKPPKDRTAFAVAGTVGGTVDLDNITIWSVKPEPHAEWAKVRATLPPPTATPTGKSPAANKTKKAPEKASAAGK